MSFGLDVLLVLTPALHVLLSPYTKVEESFNLHATHDVLFYGISPGSLLHFDHFLFPGPITRTFIPSILLSWVSSVIVRALDVFGLVNTKADLQVIVRLTLATINGLGLCALRRAVARRFGRPASVYFTLLSCTQFHLPFWMGRTIPNMFAFFPTNIALSLLIGLAPGALRPSAKRLSAAISLLIFASAVIRAEIAVLAAITMLQAFLLGYMTLSHLIKVGVAASLSAILCTMLVDSYMWQQKFLWPEFESIFFNVWQGNSAEWGTSPFGTYFISYLPKLLLASLPLSVVGVVTDSRCRNLLLPALVYVLALSCLGHKEWRFIVYVVPIFNIAAALGARWLTSLRKGRFIGRLMYLVVYGLLAANLLLTVIFTQSSMNNYPGGEALTTFNAIYENTNANVHVHISNLAAQTGASLFLQTHSEPFWPSQAVSNVWIYNKTEHISASNLDSDTSITHLIAESPSAHSQRRWKPTANVYGFSSWAIDRDLIKSKREELVDRIWNAIRMVQDERLIVLERIR